MRDRHGPRKQRCVGTELPVQLEQVGEAEACPGAPQAWPLWAGGSFCSGKRVTFPDLSLQVRLSTRSLPQEGHEVTFLSNPERGIQGPPEWPNQQLWALPPDPPLGPSVKAAPWLLGSEPEELKPTGVRRPAVEGGGHRVSEKQRGPSEEAAA